MEYKAFADGVKDFFSRCDDFFCREGNLNGARFSVLSLRGVTSRDFISESVLRPMLNKDIASFNGDFGSLLECPSITAVDTVPSAADFIAKGETLVLIQNQNGFFKTLINAQLTQGRGIKEPDSDVTVRGPKAGFTEDCEKNVAMLRKYIRTPNLKLLGFNVGDISSTRVIVAYVDGRADTALAGKIATRISNLKASVITDSAHIAMLICGRQNRLLPTCGSSEKVDKVASKLMAGRIAIIVDGSPFVLTLPYLFIEGLQSAEDYLHTPYYATFIRALRLFAMLSAIFAPAILCAAVNYNPNLMPAEFYGIIKESRKEIPISFFWEIISILLLFEVLREVGVRMPRTVGDAVGIVGSVILGNTAVEAGIVSSVGVITVAFSAVCAFITPAFMYVIVLARVAVLIAAELLGIWGLIASAVVLFLMICFKKSFGTPYFYPIIPFNAKAFCDTVICNPKKTLGRKEKLNKKG
ncbi:MAG: spore germination protein [Clostridia bacterium]|nr:spore germination protein [Clostridia bacterium]